MHALRTGYGLLPERTRRRMESWLVRSRLLARAVMRAGVDWTVREVGNSPSFYRVVDDVVQYLVRHPDVEALIHQQSASFVRDAVDDVRSEATRGDRALDRVMVKLRRRLRRDGS